MTLDQLEKEFKQGLVKFYTRPPSQFTAITVIELHKWMDQVLSPYIKFLEDHQLQQMKLGDQKMH